MTLIKRGTVTHNNKPYNYRVETSDEPEFLKVTCDMIWTCELWKEDLEELIADLPNMIDNELNHNQK